MAVDPKAEVVLLPPNGVEPPNMPPAPVVVVLAPNPVGLLAPLLNSVPPEPKPVDGAVLLLPNPPPPNVLPDVAVVEPKSPPPDEVVAAAPKAGLAPKALFDVDPKAPVKMMVSGNDLIYDSQDEARNSSDYVGKVGNRAQKH